MNEVFINGIVSFIGALVAVFIGVTLPRFFEKNDALSEQKKWSKFFYNQLLDISSKVKYPLDRKDAINPLIINYSTNYHPQIRDWEDYLNQIFNYDFSINIDIFNYYKDNIPSLKSERIFGIIKIYEIVLELDKIKKSGPPITLLEYHSPLIDQVKSLLTQLEDPKILYELQSDF